MAFNMTIGKTLYILISVSFLLVPDPIIYVENYRRSAAHSLGWEGSSFGHKQYYNWVQPSQPARDITSTKYHKTQIRKVNI